MRVGIAAFLLALASLSPAAASEASGTSGPDAQGRYLVRCIVDLPSGGQIAVINANSEAACGTAAPQCIGERAWTAIQWNENPLYTKPGSAEVCELAQ